MTEAQLHKAVAEYLTVALPRDAVWTTFPAGGGGKVRGAQLKARGLRAGWPDIQILWRHPALKYATFIGIELKSAGGSLEPEQIACHQAIREIGGIVEVCRTVMQVENALRHYSMPLRATALPGGGWRKSA